MRLLTAFEFCYIASKNELVLKEKFKAKFELIYGRLLLSYQENDAVLVSFFNSSYN